SAHNAPTLSGCGAAMEPDFVNTAHTVHPERNGPRPASTSPRSRPALPSGRVPVPVPVLTFLNFLGLAPEESDAAGVEEDKMPEPSQPPLGLSRAERALLERLMFDEAWDIVWKALARFRFPPATHANVAEDAVSRGWCKRERYKEEAGTLAQWF